MLVTYVAMCFLCSIMWDTSSSYFKMGGPDDAKNGLEATKVRFLSLTIVLYINVFSGESICGLHVLLTLLHM